MTFRIEQEEPYVYEVNCPEKSIFIEPKQEPFTILENGSNGVSILSINQTSPGPRGRGFFYEDFTPEQLESLKGEPGQNGLPAGFGEVTATASSLPSQSEARAVVRTSGPDTEKNFSFEFGIPAGEKGEDGQAATIQVSNTITVNPDTPASVINEGTSQDARLVFHIPQGQTGSQGLPGQDGESAGFGSVTAEATTLSPGSEATASVSTSGTNTRKNFSFSFGIPEGQRGLQGLQGPAGESATVSVGITATGEPGTNASVTNVGTSQDAVFNFVIPRGSQGEQGIQGNPGRDGSAATISVGSVTTGEAGSDAEVTNSGTSSQAVFDFTIPRGNQGNQGIQGEAATISVGTVTSGETPSVTNSGTSSDAVFDFVLPKGDKGDKGNQGVQGEAATITVGSVVSGDTPSVTNSGTSTDAVFNFVLPKGDKGSKGDKGNTGNPGEAATISVGNVSTGQTASVINTGTSQNAVFDFVIPKGDKGAKGDTGDAATITLGYVISGNDAQIINTGDSHDAIYNFVLPRGNQGIPGPRGSRGDQGEPGVKGDAATITIGSVITGQAGTQASVTNTGTAQDAVLNFVIPRGAQGPAGVGDVNDVQVSYDSGQTWESAMVGDTAKIIMSGGGGGGGGGQINTIEVIQKNGVDLPINRKTVNVIVPTVTSDLINDSGYITIASVPTKTSDLVNDSGYLTSQVQSDWDETDTSSASYINNKPTIVTPVQSDWSENSSSSLAYIQNKPTIPVPVNNPVNYEQDSSHYIGTNFIDIWAHQKRMAETQYTLMAMQILVDSPYTPVASEYPEQSFVDYNSLNSFSYYMNEKIVQSNWTESDSTSKAYIQNKPTALSDFTNDLGLANVAYSGSYTDLINVPKAQNETIIVDGDTGGTRVTSYNVPHLTVGDILTLVFRKNTVYLSPTIRLNWDNGVYQVEGSWYAVEYQSTRTGVIPNAIISNSYYDLNGTQSSTQYNQYYVLQILRIQ